MTKTTEGFLPVTLRLPHTAVWKDRDALWRFMDLLFMCSFSDRKVRVGGKDVEVKRGEAIVSKRELSVRWGIARTQVDAFLQMLVGEGLCETDSVANTYTRLRVGSFLSPAGLAAGVTAGVAAGKWRVGQQVTDSSAAGFTAGFAAGNAATYTRNTNIRNYKKKENLYIREKELDLEDKFNNPDNFLW